MILGINLFSLPIVVAILILGFSPRPLRLRLPLTSLSYLIGLFICMFQTWGGMSFSGLFLLFLFLQSFELAKAKPSRLFDITYLMQSLFFLEALQSKEVFPVLVSLSAIGFIQGLRNYLAAKDISTSKTEILAVVKVAILFWFFVIYAEGFNFSEQIGLSSSKLEILSLIAFSLILILLLLFPWKGSRAGNELVWTNTSLVFYVLLQAKLVGLSRLFDNQLFVGEYAANTVRWMYLLVAAIVLIMSWRGSGWLRRLVAQNFLAAIAILLLHSFSSSDPMLIMALLIFMICMLLQSYGLNLSSDFLEVKNQIYAKLMVAITIFLPLAPLSGAQREAFPASVRRALDFSDVGTAFYFPAALVLILMVVSCANALILSNDRLLFTEEDRSRLSLKDLAIPFSALPFIFLGIYPSPLYNYIQKYIFIL